MYEKLKFIDEEGQAAEFFVLEQTRINNTDYLLIADARVDFDDEEQEELEVIMVKDVSAPEDKEAVYELVEDEEEVENVWKIFDEILEGIDE